MIDILQTAFSKALTWKENVCIFTDISLPKFVPKGSIDMSPLVQLMA